MFDQLSERLQGALGDLRKQGRLDEESVSRAMREIRLALLEADVNFEVVKDFVARVRERAVGEEVLKSLTPGQQVVKIVHDELTALMGTGDSRLAFAGRLPTVILLAGLQGSGKTTAAAKLALLLRKEGKQPALVAADLQRPAAIDQLEQLGRQIQIPVYSDERRDPVRAVRDGLDRAQADGRDTVILDTAGRLHVDTELMEEVQQIERAVETHERLFVIDAMAGQDAVNAARAFGAALDLTGVILTKADGDARGGAALSVREITGKPIVLVGVGEKLEALEPFDAERMAGRILGMGDVVALVEQVTKQVDVDEAQKLAKKVAKGKGFDLVDLRSQLEQLQKMGGVASLMDKLPQAAMKGGAVAPDQGDKDVRRQIAIINSMTRKERRNPALLDGSRRRRIAAGAGVQVQDVNRLMKQFMEMQKMMKSFSGGKLKRMMQAFKGGVPPGFPGMK